MIMKIFIYSKFVLILLFQQWSGGNDCKKKQGPPINKPQNPKLNSLIKLHSLTPQDIQFLM